MSDENAITDALGDLLDELRRIADALEKIAGDDGIVQTNDAGRV